MAYDFEHREFLLTKYEIRLDTTGACHILAHLPRAKGSIDRVWYSI